MPLFDFLDNRIAEVPYKSPKKYNPQFPFGISY